MARGISSSIDGTGNDCRCEHPAPENLSATYYSSPLSMLSASPASSLKTASHAGHRKPHRKKDMANMFYGEDDYDDMKDYMYREDVIESMRREKELKDLRQQRKKKWQWLSLFECYEFLKLFITKF
ncbi:hypothetical protein L6164_023367 [Bauhinia variegata]|uniref:Uncharacterized protein n=1 Tax=Bauhinia variegata TaxID=167791 RepID=A0ACB9MIM2_BAUVA|nr:hypothetical protein L6164_023367 [Bauhinia variegata]